MYTKISTQLPHFETLNATARDAVSFAAMWEQYPFALPTERLFMVSHAMMRNTPTHTHDYFEFAYVMNGRVKNVVDGTELFLLPDSLCLMCPGSSHALIAIDPDAIVVNLCLRPQLFDSGIFHDFLSEETVLSRTMRGAENHRFMIFSDGYGRILKRSMTTLLKEYDHAGHTPSYAVTARTLLLLAQLSEVETYSFYGVDREMMEILAHIERHPGEVSVASLARHFGYNDTYFSHLVRQKVGLRVRELIVAARLRKAKELLTEGELSVQAISEAVGYASYSHFNRIFKQAYAITPAAYRAFVTGGIAGQ